MSVTRLADHSGKMKHYSVVDMLEDVLADVKENPDLYQNAYVLIRENQPDGGWDHHHIRAGFVDDVSSLGYLQMAVSMRVETVRGKR